MRASVTSLLRDKPPPFQQACFRCILQFHLISLLNRKPVLLYLCYFVLSIHLLIITCIHFMPQPSILAHKIMWSRELIYPKVSFDASALEGFKPEISKLGLATKMGLATQFLQFFLP
jgi:hypothetical protein